ncbi:GNAT family N-acetyltransferase [bacterium]|nr:GNAT family N-acetyltransferase [bacterium]
MQSSHFLSKTPVQQTPRVKQMRGLFDLTETDESVVEIPCSLNVDQLEHEWNVGLIVGRSGAGKSTVARNLFGDLLDQQFPWSRDRSIVDDFPDAMSIKEITGLLTSVGFSSPPSWLRPFHCLSNGEQFRVYLARVLAEQRGIAVVDEFTSVVDRTVAKVGSHAIAKTVRRRKQKFVAVGCHYDVIDWLDPDWIYEPEHDRLHWRRERQRRPEIELQIDRVDSKAWHIFAPHHYLTGTHHTAAHCYLASYNGQPVAWLSVLAMPHGAQPFWRAHRLVVLPDFQACGIGTAFEEAIASAYKATGKPYHISTAHPGLIASKKRSPLWLCRRYGRLQKQAGVKGSFNKTAATARNTASFRYIGEPNEELRQAFGIPMAPPKKRRSKLARLKPWRQAKNTIRKKRRK